MPATGVLAKMLSGGEGVALCWLGNAGWVVRCGGRLVGFDLDLNPGGLRLETPAPCAEKVAPHLDVHLITHEHEDHFSTPTCRLLAEQGECLFVVA